MYYWALSAPSTCLTGSSSSSSSSSSERSSFATFSKTTLLSAQTESPAHRKRMRQIRKYQNKLINCRRKIGIKICHFILVLSAGCHGEQHTIRPSTCRSTGQRPDETPHCRSALSLTYNSRDEIELSVDSIQDPEVQVVTEITNRQG